MKICWMCNGNEVPSGSYTGLCPDCESEQSEEEVPQEFRVGKPTTPPKKDKEPRQGRRPTPAAAPMNKWDFLDSLIDDLPEDIADMVDGEEPLFHLTPKIFNLGTPQLPSFVDAAKKAKKPPPKKSPPEPTKPPAEPARQTGERKSLVPSPHKDQLQPGETVDHWMARIRGRR